MPTVSVLLPTYNAEDHLDDALASIVSQTFEDFEVLVIDDGSSDGTVEIVKAYEDDRIELIQRHERGLPGALNRGIEEAAGEYIARQDADDVSAPGRFDRQVEFLRDEPNVGLLGTAADHIDEQGVITDRRRVLARPVLDDLLARNQFIHGSVMMLRSAVRAVGGYDERFENAEDYDLWLRLAQRFDVANIDEQLYQLRLRPGSIYGQDIEAAKRWEWAAKRRIRANDDSRIKQLINEGDMDGVLEGLSRQEQARFHSTVGLEFLRYHDLQAARHHLGQAIRLDPDLSDVLGFGLSFLPWRIETIAERLYRMSLNTKIALRNRIDTN